MQKTSPADFWEVGGRGGSGKPGLHWNGKHTTKRKAYFGVIVTLWQSFWQFILGGGEDGAPFGHRWDPLGDPWNTFSHL